MCPIAGAQFAFEEGDGLLVLTQDAFGAQTTAGIGAIVVMSEQPLAAVHFAESANVGGAGRG